LEAQGIKFFLRRKKSWHLKSWALWLVVGDQNTKYFQNFANYRRNYNTIWELRDANGVSIAGFKELATLGVKHFQGLFKENAQVKMGEMLQMIALFPRMIEEEDVKDLFHEVSKEELQVIIASFKKDKILVLMDGRLSSTRTFLKS
jgi:hypothetical protein